MFKVHLILKRHQSVPFFSLKKVFTESNSLPQNNYYELTVSHHKSAMGAIVYGIQC